VQIHEFLKFLSKKAAAAAPRRDSEEKRLPLPRRAATVKKKRLPLPRRYSHSGSGAAVAAAAPLWTSLFYT
jgi:hypothetical protein